MEPDTDRWEESVAESYEEYVEFTKEEGHYIMSFTAYRNQIINEMDEHHAELEECNSY